MGATRGGFVSVVAPLRDAEGYAAGFARDCLAELAAHYRDYELILVDDASSDGTADAAAELLSGSPNLRLVRLSRRFGPDVAMVAGLDTAIGDVVVLMRPECDPPSEIPEMVAKVCAGWGVVTGVDARGPRPDGLAAAALRRAFHAYTNGVLGLEYPPRATAFQALGRAAATAASRSRGKRPTFPLLASQVGFGGALHAYAPARRPGAPSPDRLFEKVDRGLTVISNASAAPLRGAAYLALLLAAANAAYAAFLAASGAPASGVHLALLGAGLFGVLAALAEGAGRTLVEVIDRPLYHVAEERNGSALLPFDGRRNVEEAA